ncbi:hypothetical protein [Oceanibacterium hippocampi]|uniref:hypothetical protein n=1 Tax=Oceanibacterium hippocampi TaxID=745714 RepID=UPI001C381218|nr:hypothetical protein [Oceanibacterium hippocampi]
MFSIRSAPAGATVVGHGRQAPAANGKRLNVVSRLEKFKPAVGGVPGAAGDYDIVKGS